MDYPLRVAIKVYRPTGAREPAAIVLNTNRNYWMLRVKKEEREERSEERGARREEGSHRRQPLGQQTFVSIAELRLSQRVCSLAAAIKCLDTVANLSMIVSYPPTRPAHCLVHISFMFRLYVYMCALKKFIYSYVTNKHAIDIYPLNIYCYI